MSDSETPQDGPGPASPASEAHSADAGTEPSLRPLRPRLTFSRVSDVNMRELVGSRKALWAAVAALCVAVGIVGSLLAAHAVARNDAASARQASQQASAAVAATVKLAIQREEDLRIGGSTFFAGNSKATPAEFDRWAHWARTLRRYPELQQLGLVTLVHGSELATFGTRASGRATQPSTALTTRRDHAYDDARERGPASEDHSRGHASLLLPRDRAARAQRRAERARRARLLRERNRAAAGARLGSEPHDGGLSGGHDRTGSHDARVQGRPAARDARRAHGRVRRLAARGVRPQHRAANPPCAATRATRCASATPAAPRTSCTTAAAPQPGAPSTTIDLHNGWTVQGFGTPVAAGSLSDGNALALLIVGCVLSALLGLLVLILGDGRPPSSAPAQPRAPKTKAPEAPVEELHDTLTGLPNRALMMDRAECMLARAGRQSGLLVGALFIDIDWFKDVNERLGEAAGDEILKIVAERLETVVRAGDTVGRLGGDEFVLLVESAARGARLDSLARRVVEALHKPFELADDGPNFLLTASIGVAFGRYATPEDLLRDAQLALHAAKSAGKDRYTLFNANMRSVIEGRGVLEVELNAALAEKQFFVLYEPIYDLGTGRVAGLEAQIRWLHPKQGVVLPDDFIPLAEETGLTVPIGRWVMEEACTRAAAWNVAGHNVGISVGVTANQLNRDGFVTDVRRALQQSGIEPSLLTLEIAETTVMSDVTAAVERLQEIKQLGVRIAIDDFGGSGYAYHSDLRRLPLDFLKVDRSSLAATEDEEYRTWLLEAILIVGRDLSLTVIAKGIESLEQMSALQAMGCTMAQGTLMGKAVPANAIDNVFDVTLPTTRPSSESL